MDPAAHPFCLTDAAIEASKEMPMGEVLNRMGAYNERLHNAGVIVGFADNEYVQKDEGWREQAAQRASGLAGQHQKLWGIELKPSDRMDRLCSVMA